MTAAKNNFAFGSLKKNNNGWLNRHVCNPPRAEKYLTEGVSQCGVIAYITKPKNGSACWSCGLYHVNENSSVRKK